MVKLTEVAPTAGLTLKWHDFLVLPFFSYSKNTLETKLAKYIGVEDAQVECSGTAALVVALETLKQFSDRKQVVMSAYTCPWVALAVIHCGLTPVLADSRKEHFDYCQNALKKSCNQDTLVVVHTHLAGRVADVKKTLSIAKGVGAYVIEDAAQSLGATMHGKSVGLLGDIGFYSLGVGKGLTIFAGGVLVTENPVLREVMKRVGSTLPFDWMAEAKRVTELVAYYWLYRPLGMGLAFGHQLRRKLKRGRLVEAVGDDCTFKFPIHRVGVWRKGIGARAMRRLSDFFALTREQAQKRVAMLSEIEGLRVVKDDAGGQGVWPFIIIMLPSESLRDEALEQLWRQGLGVGRLFIHAIKDYDYLSAYFTGADIPNAQDFAARTLIMTNSLWLKDKDFLKIRDVLAGCLVRTHAVEGR
jgi:dTDP-4-amino-4,6-dideoxygalactose transaminase